jgi:hypothetical protein
MSNIHSILLLIIVVLLTSCGGGGGDVNLYKVRAEVVGLNGSLTLSTNEQSKTVTQDQSVNQLVLLEEGVSYNVVVTQQPVGQQCSVINGSGTINAADIADIVVTCENIEYTIMGNVSGLVNELVLSVEGGGNLTIATNGAFDSERSYIHQDTYSISIEIQPTGQTCVLIYGSGAINAADIADIVVTCENTPIVPAMSKQTDEDQALHAVLESEVIDVTSQVFSITVQPDHGLLSLDDSNTGTYIYTPDENYFGVDSFTFSVNDGTVDSPEGIVDIIISTVNDAPVANYDSRSVAVNETIEASAGSDVEGETLTLNFVSLPTKGSIVYSVDSGNYTYTPVDTGLDQFTFTLNDGTSTSNQATVQFNVTPVTNLTETSDNNVKETATQHYQNSIITGALSDIEDVDWYQFDAFADGSVQLDFSSLVPAENDAFLITVEDANGNILVSVFSGNDAILRFSVEDGKSYFIRSEEGRTTNSDNYQILLEYYPSSIAILRWTVPVENTDGSTYDNRKGYNIYYGTSANQLTETFYLDDPTVVGDGPVQLDQIIQHLRQGNTYYFTMTAISDSYNESDYSNMASIGFPSE